LKAVQTDTHRKPILLAKAVQGSKVVTVAAIIQDLEVVEMPMAVAMHPEVETVMVVMRDQEPVEIQMALIMHQAQRVRTAVHLVVDNLVLLLERTRIIAQARVQALG
jgi:hypothetical protein